MSSIDRVSGKSIPEETHAPEGMTARSIFQKFLPTLRSGVHEVSKTIAKNIESDMKTKITGVIILSLTFSMAGSGAVMMAMGPKEALLPIIAGTAVGIGVSTAIGIAGTATSGLFHGITYLTKSP